MDELDFSAAETDRSVRRQSSDRREKVRKGKFLPKKTKKSQLKKAKAVKTAKPTTKREPKAKAKAKAAMKPKPSHLRRALELLDGLLEMAENQVDDGDQRRRLLRPGRIRLGSDCAGLGSDFVSLKASLGDDVCVKTEPWTQHIQKIMFQLIQVKSHFFRHQCQHIMQKFVLILSVFLIVAL